MKKTLLATLAVAVLLGGATIDTYAKNINALSISTLTTTDGENAVVEAHTVGRSEAFNFDKFVELGFINAEEKVLIEDFVTKKSEEQMKEIEAMIKEVESMTEEELQEKSKEKPEFRKTKNIMTELLENNLLTQEQHDKIKNYMNEERKTNEKNNVLESTAKYVTEGIITATEKEAIDAFASNQIDNFDYEKRDLEFVDDVVFNSEFEEGVVMGEALETIPGVDFKGGKFKLDQLANETVTFEFDSEMMENLEDGEGRPVKHAFRIHASGISPRILEMLVTENIITAEQKEKIMTYEMGNNMITFENAIPREAAKTTTETEV